MISIRLHRFLFGGLCLLIATLSIQCGCIIMNPSDSPTITTRYLDDPKDKDKDPLVQAAHNGTKPSLAKALKKIDKGNFGNINQPIHDSTGDTALHDAAELGNIAIIQKLLDNGAEVDIMNNSKTTPLGYAIQKGNTAAVQFLLDKGANIYAQMGVYRDYPIHIAANTGNTDMVKLLLEKDPDLITVTNRNTSTPLHVAAEHGNLEIVKLLLEHSANLFAEDTNDKNPVQTAIKFGKPEIVRLLLDKAPTLIDAISREDLDIAIRYNQVEVAKLLLERKPALIKLVDYQGNTPLHFAIDKSDVNMIKLLLEKGARTSIMNQSEKTPLDLAIQRGDKMILKVLLEHLEHTEEKWYNDLAQELSLTNNQTKTLWKDIQKDKKQDSTKDIDKLDQLLKNLFRIHNVFDTTMQQQYNEAIASLNVILNKTAPGLPVINNFTVANKVTKLLILLTGNRKEQIKLRG